MTSPTPGWAHLESERLAISGRLSHFAQAIGWSAFGIGLVVLILGWWLHHPAVASLVPGEVTMKANAAVGMGLTGLVIVGVTRGWKPWVPSVFASLVFVIGAVTLLEYVADSPWSGFDQLLARERSDAVATAAPGRMGANTAFDYVILGIAGILLARRKAPNLRQTLSLVVAAVGTVAVLGYALQVPALSGQFIGATTRMAIPTAVIHLFLGVGLVVATTDRGWATLFSSPLAGGRIARIWTPLLLVVVAALSVAAHNLDDVGALHAVAHQLGLAVSIVVIATVMFILAGFTDRLDQARLRQAADAVDRSERLYKLGFERSPVGIALVGQNGNFLDVNRAFADMVGKPAQLIQSFESVSTVSGPSRLSTNLEVLHRLMSGAAEEASLETAISAVDGREIPIQVDVVRVDFAGGPVLFGHIKDLTEVRAAQRALEEKNQELTYLAERDPLTGVLNRRGFLDHVQAALNSAPDNGQPPAVLFVDIDGFKQINDVYGHHLGDRFLVAMADRLTRNTSAENGRVGRVGGDEFAVLLIGYQPAEVEGVARRLERGIRDRLIVDGITLRASGSIGHAVADGVVLDCEELMARADQDMYAARRARAAGLERKIDELGGDRSRSTGHLLPTDLDARPGEPHPARL